MKSLLDVTSINLIKIFNTISHIIYSETTGEAKNTLRRTEYQLTRDDIDFFNKEKFHYDWSNYTNEDFLKMFPSAYKISVVNDDKKNNTSIYIIFSTIVNNTDYIINRSFTTDHMNNMYLFIDTSILDIKNEQIQVEGAIKILTDFFFNVLNTFKNDNPVFRGNNTGKVFISNSHSGHEIIDDLSKLFANMIISNPYMKKEDKLLILIQNIFNEYTDMSTSYVKLDISKNSIEYIIDYLTV